MIDSTAQMVKRMATMIMMAPTGLFVPMMVKAAIQPLEAADVLRGGRRLHSGQGRTWTYIFREREA